MLSTDIADLKKFMAENTGAVIEDVSNTIPAPSIAHETAL